MITEVGFIDGNLRDKDRDFSTCLDNISNGISKRISRYCRGRLARDLEVRNCLKHIENNVAHLGASACAADVRIRLERLDE